ncbi:hypothetical protein [Marinobacter sp.]|uniref:hypothetical protein n=1 Tax=Marinobacter sp. TaxID=50741 RepID=UPI0035654684
MYNRIDLPLGRSTLTGVLAAGPWALLAIVALGLAVTWHWLLAPVPVLLLATGLDRWRHNGSLTAAGAVVRLTTRGQRLYVRLANGHEEEAEPSAGSRISGRYLVLDLRGQSSGRRYPLILLPMPLGNAPGAPLRRLRVWLRLMPEPPAPIDNTPWYKNFSQRIWPGDKTHDHRYQ